MRRDLTVDDFATGLLAALASRGVRVISIRGDEFYGAIEKAFHVLEATADDKCVDVRFAVYLDPLHGDSPVVREAISTVVLRDLASLDNPEYQDLRLKIVDDQAKLLLETLPGGEALYQQLADAFVRSYPYITSAVMQEPGPSPSLAGLAS